MFHEPAKLLEVSLRGGVGRKNIQDLTARHFANSVSDQHQGFRANEATRV